MYSKIGCNLLFICIHSQPNLKITDVFNFLSIKCNFFVCFVDRESLYNLVNKANLVHNFSYYVYFFSLHVSGDYVPIIRRNNCTYATLGTCYSVWMTVW
jgi:hypothetical protein